jgi:hypothetical protein
MPSYRCLVLGIILLAAGLSPARATEAQPPADPPAPAAEGAARERTWLVSLYAGQWADTNLPDLPRRMVDGSLRFESPKYVGIGLNRALIRAYDLPLPFGIRLRGNSLELDTSLLQHFDGQDNIEAAAALMARTGQIRPGLGLGFNLAAGAGLSYAFGTTGFEIGRDGVQGQDTYRLQIHLVFEVEAMQADLPGWSVLARLHHRSGGYGLVSPQRTGSNFLGFGLRRSF